MSTFAPIPSVLPGAAISFGVRHFAVREQLDDLGQVVALLLDLLADDR